MIPVKPEVDVMNSAICDREEMKCCEEKGVLMKGCHDHRIITYKKQMAERKVACVVK